MVTVVEVVLVACASGWPVVPSAPSMQEPAPPAAAYQQTLQTLCSDRMGGRAAGTEGGDRAIEWLAAEFARAGAAPLFATGFVQSFAVPDPEPPEPTARTRCQVLAGAQAFDLRVGVDCMPMPFAADGAFRGDLVFAGHALPDGEAGRSDFTDVDLAGKAALLLRGGPKWRDPDVAASALAGQWSLTTKVGNAAERGAIAVCIVDRRDAGGAPLTPATVPRTVGAAAVPVVWLTRAAVDGFAGPGWLDAAQAALDAGESPPPLPPLRIDGAVELRRAPARASANVVGRFAPAMPDHVREWIVVGAHHDHIGHGEFGSLASGAEVGRLHPGADDNASGVAALLEVARRLAAKAPRGRTVVTAAFGAEERMQLGSRAFLQQLPADVVVVAMVELNMIGRARSRPLGVHGVGSGTGLRQLVERTAATVPTLRTELRDRTAYRSDQAVFLAAQMPSLLLTTGLHGEYHRPADVSALVEIDAALAVVDLAEALVRELAAGPAPAFVPPPRR